MTHQRRLSTLLLVLAAVAVFGGRIAESRFGVVRAADGKVEAARGMLHLDARTRVETEQGSGRFHTITNTIHWDPKKTALVVCDMWNEHWCPTITRADFLGGKPFRLTNDKRLHLVIVTVEQEYKTDETLPPFAISELGKDFKISHVFANAQERNDLPGIEVLDEADVALISVRRRVPPKAQLDVVRRFIAAGKPVVGIRTASHAFSLGRDRQPPAGHDAWPSFDAEILGGNYHGHHGSKGPKVTVKAAAGAEGHPILAGVDLKTLVSSGSLYKVSPLAESTTPLLIGSVPDKEAEPVAWTNKHKHGGRVFYTSLGHPDDFKLPAFRRLLKNGIYWAAGLTGKKTAAKE